LATTSYTLLIVESPIIAKIIQELSPQSVYVIATEGYCWKPRYDADTNQLNAIADPTKASIRKEIKEQAEWANTIIVATDSDPSGDFIAWSIERFLSSKQVKRGRLQSLSKSGVIAMLSELSEIESNPLETRLKNRFLIKSEWFRQNKWPDIQLSGLISIFGKQRTYNHFIGENNQLFKSSESLRCSSDEFIRVSLNKESSHFTHDLPLSTFDLIPIILNSGLSLNYTDAQQILQQLFESTLRDTGNSLISYPRTEARGFYTDTWEVMQTQHLKSGFDLRLKPSFLRAIASPETPHESVHPIDLTSTPDSVSGELSSQIGTLYELIYMHTLKSIRIPEPLQHTYSNALLPDLFFYQKEKIDFNRSTIALRPCITVDEIGIEMNNLGVLKPSGFGSSLDKWIDKGWIHIDYGTVTPGKTILEQLQKGTALERILLDLNQKAELNSLHPETIQTILSSD
jgi:5S rRNA maturation endonuclease (ribonuclease M5)